MVADRGGEGAAGSVQAIVETSTVDGGTELARLVLAAVATRERADQLHDQADDDGDDQAPDVQVDVQEVVHAGEALVPIT